MSRGHVETAKKVRHKISSKPASMQKRNTFCAAILGIGGDEVIHVLLEIM
jgi:hypothetical protein